ncbi:MAG: LamG-like jellyroll fold domain-containing protein, partial [Nitrospirota bacterium]
MQSGARIILISIVVLCLTVVFGPSHLFAQSSPARGPLLVHPTNPRYFADPTGQAVYLTGSHTWSNLQDGETSPFNYTSYLGLLQASNHNFIRLWISESPRGDGGLTPAPGFIGSSPWYQQASPLPYARTGPGSAADGLPKFSLNQFDQAYFDRLRSRVIAARDRGIYVGIMLFNFRTAWNANDLVPNRNVWRYHPYNINNNVSGVNGDPNGDGNGEETHKLQVAAVTQAQEAYVRKVIDTVNDLDNVIYEVSNGDTVGDPAWQFHIINVMKNYEAGKSKQHPIGMTGAEQISNSLLLTNPGEWTSFAATTYNSSSDPYSSSPPASNGTRVSILDTDHIGYSLFQNDPVFTRAWIWKSFTRGHHPILMEDTTGFSGWVAGRSAMGHTRSYATRMNLAGMTPLNALSSTNYCLASAGQEYLVYQPETGPFTINLSGGAYAYEWFNPVTGSIAGTGTIGATGGDQLFTPPFSGPAVLYLKASGASLPATPSVASPAGHWKLDDGSGSIVADASGNGLAGTLMNKPVWTSGWFGGGLILNGTNDYVHIPNPGTLSPQKLTLSLWVKPASFANANSNSTLANVGLHERSDGYYGLAIDTAGKPVAMVNIGDGEGNAFSLKGPVLTVGQWSHLAVTYDNVTLRLYVDGAAAGQVSINRVRTTSPAPLILGRRGDAGYFFKGVLDDVQVYSQALSAGDIAGLVGGALPPAPLPSSPSSSHPLASSRTGVSSFAGASSLAAVSPLIGAAPLPFAAAAVTTYRASSDYASVQGNRGWYYLNMIWNAAANQWQGGEPFNWLWNTGGHPGNASDAVKRWVAPSSGTIRITGNAKDLNPGGGGGVTVSIRTGSTVLWTKAIANGNTTGFNFNVTTTVTPYQFIDFVINRGADGNNGWDATGFD